MRCYRLVLLSMAAATQAGCCLENQAAFTPVPAPRLASVAGERAAFGAQAEWSTEAAALAARAEWSTEAAAPASTSFARAAPSGGLETFSPRSAAAFEGITPQVAPYRDPQRAFCLACIIAGGGHFYSGETTKGAALLGIAAGALIGGAALSSDGGDEPFECEYDPETHACESGGGRTPLLVGAGIAAASWIYGIVDSRASAERANAGNGGRTAQALEMRPLLDLGPGGTGAGLSVRVTW